MKPVVRNHARSLCLVGSKAGCNLQSCPEKVVLQVYVYSLLRASVLLTPLPNPTQARNQEQEEKLKQSTDSLSQLNLQLFEKHVQIDELERRVQRMEEVRLEILFHQSVA